MPEPKRPLKVFLCHAHSDKYAVRDLYFRLTKDGVDVWLDKEKLLPGQDWELEIRKAVRKTDLVIVCLSKQFNQAGFRQKEVRVALDTAMEQLEGEIFIIPAKLEECNTPESLHRYHQVDLFTDGGYEKLIKALQLRGEQLERARVQKEEAVKRRLPYFETPGPQNRVTQQNGKYTNNVDKKPGEYLALKKAKNKRRIKTEYVVAIIGAVATIVAGILSSPLIEKWASPIPAATELSTVIAAFTDQPIVPSQTLESIRVSDTPTITITPASSLTSTTFPLPTAIMDTKGVPMALVPEGKFTMGNVDSFANERPVFLVYLNSYYIDKYEVTNRNYNLCVQAGECLPPKKKKF
ncbi:MAG: TIR domain-containing protein [Anaerolineales bacterium]|nr:TIR domain-containing protein [Anaerolineales bacterium]